MASGEAEAFSAIGSFDGPQQRFPATDSLLDVRVGAFGVDVGAISSRFGGDGGEYGSKLDAIDLCGFSLIEACGESHIEVPFVADFEGLDAAADGVIREGLEFGIPDWVAGSLVFVAATDPALEFCGTAVFGHFDAEVHAAESDTAGDEFFEELESIFLNGRVSGTAIGEDHDCGSICESGFVFDPAHFVSFDFQIGDVLESFFEQDCAGAEFVHHWRVAGFTGDEDQFAWSSVTAGSLQCSWCGGD